MTDGYKPRPAKGTAPTLADGPSRRSIPGLAALVLHLFFLRPSAVCGLAAAPLESPNKNGRSSSSSTRGPAAKKKRRREYNYFAYGSNMASATMTDLRGLNPVARTAAVLPGHRLRFNVPGTPLVEPSWASVELEPAEDAAQERDGDYCSPEVHGVLYRLTEDDFSSVLRSEGVPFGYTVHRCRVVPYRGNAGGAGARAVRRSAAAAIGGGAASNEDNNNNNTGEDGGEGEGAGSVFAYTLRASRREWREGPDVPPSRSYLDVLLRGAEEFRLDASYVEGLRMIEAGRTPLAPGGNGIAGRMLATAERLKGRGSTGGTYE